MSERVIELVLGAPIDVLDWQTAISKISAWSSARASRYVCITNAHSVVSGVQSSEFSMILNGADMVTADGAPVAWMLRRLGHPKQERINGPDLMLRYCRVAAQREEAIFLLGGTETVLARLRDTLLEKFPGLVIGGSYSPPFRLLSPAEESSIVEMINKSGAGTVWVSFGCPKQERWMAANRGAVHAVMIGVGAAFDYHSGLLKRAPRWMQSIGLEWLYRLCSEPRRLWKRYFVTNCIFIAGAIGQLAKRTFSRVTGTLKS